MKAASCGSGIVVILVSSVLYYLIAGIAVAGGFPHYLQNEIECESCHYVHGDEPRLLPPWTAFNLDPADIDDTQFNSLCRSCHIEGGSGTPQGPSVETHSSNLAGTGYGKWTVECIVCHDPHFQVQAYTYTSPVDYVYHGSVSAVDTNLSTISDASATWTPDEFAGMIVIPNTAELYTSYKILSNDANTLTVKGPIDGSLVSVPGPLAISYGKLIKSPIILDEILDGVGQPVKSGSRSVKFVRASGPNSFADGDGTYDGICEVCHTQTTHFTNDGSGSDPLHANVGGPAGTNCTTACHKHSNGFAHVVAGGTECETCHNSGSHATHISTSSVRGPSVFCADCHDLDNMPGFKDGNTFATTGVCDNCHSPGGAFNGVDSDGGGSVGARDNWATGVYAGNVLDTGKERWCDGCHDDAPANSKADGTGVTARNILGDSVTYGYYQTGHGANVALDCLQCHSSRMPHIDHQYTPVADVISTTENPTNYRFYVGKDLLLPHDGTANSANFTLCYTCHLQGDLLSSSGEPFEAKTNYRQDGQISIATKYRNYHNSTHLELVPCVFCHDPHGTSAPRMTVDSRIGNFKVITLNADGKYYNLADSTKWNSAADNNGGAITAQPACSTICHGGYNANLMSGVGQLDSSPGIYTRVYNPLTHPVVTDGDSDGFPDVNDNCPAVPNADQADSDGDGIGDACDLCISTPDPSNKDGDGDGIGDVCDSCFNDPDNDIDNDGICVGSGFLAPKTGDSDNCPVNYNPGQEDTDGDGAPDACDNCPSVANADQADIDYDGIGDVCDAVCGSFVNVWWENFTSPSGRFFGIALDGNDNLYGAGVVQTAFPGETFQGGISDLGMMKFDKDGNLLNAVQFGAADDSWEYGYGIVVDDADGSIYMTGFTSGSIPPYTNLGSQDMVLVKYDSAFNQVWVKQVGTAVDDRGYTIVLDGSGNIYVGGRWGNAAALVKFDSNGNQLWQQQVTGASYTDMYIVIDGSSIYATGNLSGDIFITQFDLDGNEGWSVTEGVPGFSEQASDIVTTGNFVFVTGETYGSFPGFTLEGDTDFFVLKLDKADGSLLAHTQFVAPDKQEVTGIDTNSTGTKVYVTGYSWNEFLEPATGQFDSFLIGYDVSLQAQNIKQIQETGYFSTSNSNENMDVKVSKNDGSIYMGGFRSNYPMFLKEVEGCP